MTNNRAFTIGKLWLQWVLANTMGWVLCWALIFVVILSQAFEDNPSSSSMNIGDPTPPLHELPIYVLLSIAVVVALIAAIMGIMQWLVLKQHFEKSGTLLLATIAGWSFGIILGLAILDSAVFPIGIFGSGFVDEALLGCSIGLFSGIFQWTVLRRQVVQAGWWIIANTVGWTIAFSLPPKGLVFSLFIVGLFPGTLTGLLLIRWFCFPMGRVQTNT